MGCPPAKVVTFYTRPNDTLDVSESSSIDRCLLRCADCGNLVTGTQRNDGRIIPVGGHKCKLCDNDEFDRLDLNLE